VQFEQSLYSVPFTRVGERLWLRATDTSVAIYAEHALIAQHLRSPARGSRCTVREHLPPEAQAFFLRDRHWCTAQAIRIGPACAELMTVLLTDRIVERLRAAQGVIRLADTYGAARVEAACRRALAHGSPFYRTVKTILAAGFDQRDSLTHDLVHPYVPQARFARPAERLFAEDAGGIPVPGDPPIGAPAPL
jgi:hypothetical protein